MRNLPNPTCLYNYMFQSGQIRIQKKFGAERASVAQAHWGKKRFTTFKTLDSKELST